MTKSTPEQQAQDVFDRINETTKNLNPRDSLRFLLSLDNLLYKLQGLEAIRYGDGLHTKHRHMNYHQFFIDNTPERSQVLDIGCGNGSLAYDLALKVKGVSIIGIDHNVNNVEYAKKRFHLEAISYICGDALYDLPSQRFDVIILSNLLEHLEHRIPFLQTICQRYEPTKILIRVPLFERDWRVPLKKEIGIDHRLDETHFTEYTQESFFSETEASCLRLVHHQIRWGEIWAEFSPSRRNA